MLDRCPPGHLISAAVRLAVIDPAEWDRVFVADISAERARLGEANAMRFGGRTAAGEAWLRGELRAAWLSPTRGGPAKAWG